jgi:hypothetical protein
MIRRGSLYFKETKMEPILQQKLKGIAEKIGLLILMDYILPSSVVVISTHNMTIPL